MFALIETHSLLIVIKLIEPKCWSFLPSLFSPSLPALSSPPALIHMIGSPYSSVNKLWSHMQWPCLFSTFFNWSCGYCFDFPHLFYIDYLVTILWLFFFNIRPTFCLCISSAILEFYAYSMYVGLSLNTECILLTFNKCEFTDKIVVIKASLPITWL